MHSLFQLQNLFKIYLSENKFVKEPQGLYEPIDYIMRLGGKRLRPVLLLMSYNLFNDDVTPALPAALAIEVFHNFSLVHDDIMDRAPLRRGKPTVHTKYDENTGILAGDVMLIYAYQYLLQINDKRKIPEVISIFNQVAIEVCEGQQFDMDFESRKDVNIEEYIKMIGMKTAALIAGGLKIGAIIGGARKEDAHHISEFGRNIGIAFQLQDDILDTFGEPEKFGKKTGGDIIQNKKTILILKTFEIADLHSREYLTQLMESTPDNETRKIQQVTSLFNQFNIREQSQNLMEEYLMKAFDHLDTIKKEETRKKVLRNLANELMGRES